MDFSAEYQAAEEELRRRKLSGDFSGPTIYGASYDQLGRPYAVIIGPLKTSTARLYLKIMATTEEWVPLKRGWLKEFPPEQLNTDSCGLKCH
jgi:hypothetical protein